MYRGDQMSVGTTDSPLSSSSTQQQMLQPLHSTVKIQNASMMRQPSLGNYNNPNRMSRLKDLGMEDRPNYSHPDMQKRKWTVSESSLDPSQLWLGPDQEAPKLISPPMALVAPNKEYTLSRLFQEIPQAESSRQWKDVHSDIKVHPDNNVLRERPDAFRHDRNASASPSDHAMSEEHHVPELELRQARSPDMELKRAGSLSSEDVVDMEPARCGRGRSQSRSSKNFTVSKNLVSERKRRKKLNDGLYSLRALVPKISKMDKASIVGDAIEHVKELQQQIEAIELEIAEMESECINSANLAVDEDSGASRLSESGEHATADASGTVCEVVEVGCKLAGEVVPATDNITMVASTTDDTISLADSQNPSSSLDQKKILKMEVSHLEELTYQLQISCQKGPGVMVQLTQALESMDMDVLNAYHTSFQESILNTFIVEMRNLDVREPEDLRSILLDAVAQHGLAAQS